MSEPASPEKPPPVDEHIVREGARYEAIDGRLVMAPPADEPHGTRHFDLAYVLHAHLAEGYTGAVDMLTRTSEVSDFAPDASVFPSERAPDGRRQLEELAFEIVSAQPLGVSTDKTRELARRGVRRIFCILVRKSRVLEWSVATDDWTLVGGDDRIEDRCFARPLPVATLLDAAAADRAVVEALRDRGALREIEEASRAEGRAEGRAHALRRGVRALGRALEVPVDEAKLAAMDADELEALLDHIERERRWP